MNMGVMGVCSITFEHMDEPHIRQDCRPKSLEHQSPIQRLHNLVFADDVVIFDESLEVLLMPLEGLHKVSCLKAKVE